MKATTLTPTQIDYLAEKSEDFLLELTFNAQVMGLEGQLGYLTRIIVNSKTMQVTNIVVELLGLFGFEQYLVPIDYISVTTPQLINLDCIRDDFIAMKPFCETDYIKNEYWEHEMLYWPPNSMSYGSEFSMLWSDPFSEGVMPYLKVKKENLLPGELIISNDIQVEALDSFLGKIDGFLISKNTQIIKGLLVRSRKFLKQKERVFSAQTINKIEENKISLKFDKKSFDSIPFIPRKNFFNQVNYNYNLFYFK
ncbi:hypothetical protein [Crocosphaera sp. Alani8]|uniref:hypothetical protein n=1 Tax=Crocosphaera sp. Alani8 TaxID=3038952 RepID=UPI00313BE688